MNVVEPNSGDGAWIARAEHMNAEPAVGELDVRVAPVRERQRNASGGRQGVPQRFKNGLHVLSRVENVVVVVVAVVVVVVVTSSNKVRCRS